MKKYLSILFFVLATMFCACERNNTEPTKPLQLDSSDRQLLEQLSHDIITKLKIGMPYKTMDSMLLSYGFTYVKGEYTYNSPSEEFTLFCQGRANPGIDLPTARQQFSELLNKGKVLMNVSFMYNDKKQVSQFLLFVRHSDSISLADMRPIWLMFSDSLYQKVEALASKGYRFWTARINYTSDLNNNNDAISFADYYEKEQYQRPAYIDRITHDTRFRSWEGQEIRDTPVIQVYNFNISFALPNTNAKLPCSHFMLDYH